jgi:hypothetical protein
MKNIFVIVDNLLLPDAESWETHTSSMLHGYVDVSNLSYAIHEISDLTILKEFFYSQTVKANDVILFTNAWSPAVQYIKHWAENTLTPVKMIGLWSVGTYTSNDKEYFDVKNNHWRKLHETLNAKCLDALYFITEDEKNKFRARVTNKVDDKLGVITFPLDYLDLELASPKENFYKQNIVIFPWAKYTVLNEQIMYDFIRVFSDIKVYFAQEHQPIERRPLLNQISKSKLAFLPYTSINLGKEIYECLLLDTIPLIPNIEGLSELVPQEFTYPAEWTSDIFNYSKYAPELIDKMKSLIYDYELYTELIAITRDSLHQKLFDSEQLMQVLFGNL